MKAIDFIVEAIETLNRAKKKTPAHDKIYRELEKVMGKITISERTVKKNVGIIAAAAESMSRYKKK